MVLGKKEKMKIKEKSNDFFGTKKGCLVDNAYDKYVLNNIIRFYNENKVEYLHFQDCDLSSLSYFLSVKFLSIPDEATNVSCVNNLSELIGLEIYSSCICSINKAVLERIQYLSILFNDNSVIDFSTFKALKKLRVVGFTHNAVNITENLDFLELNCCKKINTLDFLKNIHSLKSIKLDYLPKLENIRELKNISKSLNSLAICDCKNIKDIEETLYALTGLKQLQIYTVTTDSRLTFSSLNFLKGMTALESFASNYKIADGNLSELLNLKDANITSFYKNYNLKDKDLPHTYVLIDDNGVFRKVSLASLDLGKADERIRWLN